MTTDLLALAHAAKADPYYRAVHGVALCDGIIAQAAEIERLRDQVIDNAEDWALAGIAPDSEMAKKLTERHRQREAKRVHVADLRRMLALRDARITELERDGEATRDKLLAEIAALQDSLAAMWRQKANHDEAWERYANMAADCERMRRAIQSKIDNCPYPCHGHDGCPNCQPLRVALKGAAK